MAIAIIFIFDELVGHPMSNANVNNRLIRNGFIEYFERHMIWPASDQLAKASGQSKTALLLGKRYRDYATVNQSIDNFAKLILLVLCLIIYIAVIAAPRECGYFVFMIAVALSLLLFCFDCYRVHGRDLSITDDDWSAMTQKAMNLPVDIVGLYDRHTLAEINAVRAACDVTGRELHVIYIRNCIGGATPTAALWKEIEVAGVKCFRLRADVKFNGTMVDAFYRTVGYIRAVNSSVSVTDS